jgi:hypothetical protein
MFGDYDTVRKGLGLVQATLCKTIHGSTRLTELHTMCGPVGPHSHNPRLCAPYHST